MNTRVLLMGFAAVFACVGALADVVKASSFGWNAEDATEALQKAIDSGAEKVVVDRQPGDWIVRPISVKKRIDQEVVFERGVVVRAKKGEFKGTHEPLFRFQDCRRFTFRGEGNVQLVMRKPDYQNPELYKPGEWRNAISICGGEDITVDNFLIRSTGGDAVELAYNPRRIRLFNLDCRDNHRQGISVCAASDLLVSNCVMSCTKGTPPQAGVDVEPFRANDLIENVVFEDCIFEGNGSYGFKVHLSALNGSSAPVSCTVRRCMVRNNRFSGLEVYGSDNGAKCLQKGGPGPVRGTILFEDCVGFGNGDGIFMHANIAPNGLRVIFRNCDFDVTGVDRATLVQSDLAADVAGLVCENVRITGTNDKQLNFSPVSGGGAVDFQGAIEFVDDFGRSTVFDLGKWAAAQPRDPSLFAFEVGAVDFTKLRPLNPGKVEKPIYCGNVAGKFTFLQCTPESGEYRFRFNLNGGWKNCPPPSGVFTVRDKAGTDLGEHKLQPGENEFTFRSSADNMLRFSFRLSHGSVSLYSWNRGCGLLANTRLNFMDGNGKFHFQVPAGAEGVKVKTKFGAAVGALRNAAGEKVSERTKAGTSNAMLHAKFVKTAAPEIWSVDFQGNNWFVTPLVGAPALPIVSVSRDGMIVAK